MFAKQNALLGLVPLPNGNRIPKFLPLQRFSCPYTSPATPNSLQTSPDHHAKSHIEMDLNCLYLLCTKLHFVKQLHAHLVVSPPAHTVFTSTKLVNLYANFGDLGSSRLVFEQMPRKNVFTWNSMISSYVKNGAFHEAIDCYYKVASSSVRPDFFTLPVVLKACEDLNDGRKIHCWGLKMGFGLDFFVAASLVNMYTRFGLVDEARKVFDEMPLRDLGCWNAMISGFSQNGKAVEALGVFEELRMEGVRMDSVTVSSILPICAPLDDLLLGKLIHVYVMKHGLEFDIFVSNALINMYAKLDCVREARMIFDTMEVKDLVSWNSMIAAYEQIGDPVTAVLLFDQMKQNGFHSDVLTLVSLASVAAQSGDWRGGRSVHCFIVRRGWMSKDIFVDNAIVDMYAKLGKIDYGQNVFDRMPIKDVISWNTVITGYAQNGLAEEAIDVYNLMMTSEGLTADQGTLVSVLPAFAHVGALRQGMKVHGKAIRIGLHLDMFVETCLIDMYAKCGRLDEAMLLFEQVPRMSSVPWNAIISSHGIHGHGEKALKLFQVMQEEGVKPDHVTFISLLSACSHAGLVEKGQECFQLMQRDYGIEPSVKHYACMVDLLGRAGHLARAYEFIKGMPVRPDASVWGALLGGCRIHGNVELGTLASDHLFEIDSETVGYYVLLSNIYAKVGKWERVDKVRSLAEDRGLRKTPGWSSIEVNNRVHVFFTGNRSHPQSQDIYEEIRVLLARMKSIGYVPDYSFVLQDVEEDEKDLILSSHSERLAIAFGIISTPPKALVQIFKNLRVCGDCHNATKFISVITEREIIVRDSKRFHHFKGGSCSCGDYW